MRDFQRYTVRVVLTIVTTMPRERRTATEMRWRIGMLKDNTTGSGSSMVQRSATTTKTPPTKVMIESSKHFASSGIGYVQYADTGLFLSATPPHIQCDSQILTCI